MNNDIIVSTKELIKEAEQLGEKNSLVEHYQVMLQYYVTCLEVLHDDIFNTNQRLAMRNQR